MLHTILSITNSAAPNANHLCSFWGSLNLSSSPWWLTVPIHTLIHHQEIHLQPFRSSIGMFKYLILQGLSNWFQMSLGWAWNCKPWVWACFSIDESYSFPFRKYLLLLFIICPLVILKISKWLWASHQKTDMEMPGNITSYVAVQYMDIHYHVLWYNWVGVSLRLSPGKTWLDSAMLCRAVLFEVQGKISTSYPAFFKIVIFCSSGIFFFLH